MDLVQKHYIDDVLTGIKVMKSTEAQTSALTTAQAQRLNA